MTLIKSISGIRGTIGGRMHENLTPFDIVQFGAAFSNWIRQKHNTPSRVKIVVGRDARISGQMVSHILTGTLVASGTDVVDIGLATTPTTEMAVVAEGAQAGIILTASHNPKQWNALKLLNEKGEFISAADGAELMQMIEEENYNFVDVDNLGRLIPGKDYIPYHIQQILRLPYVDAEAIKAANFSVVVDAVNSVGGIAIPPLLQALGVYNVEKMYCEPTGHFPHNPEPLAENLTEISAKVRQLNADCGIVVDPDVDRLALVSEDGSMFGEEYTLVAVADYVLSVKNGNTVSNLSSSRALKDLTHAKGQKYTASAVGEVNVVAEMKAQNAVVGGEGNGGIILPELHYGRDSLVGIAIFLTHLAKSGKKMTELKAMYPPYEMSKNKIQLQGGTNPDEVLKNVEQHYRKNPKLQVNTVDGVKIDFPEHWLHLRKSNTEPIIRIYTEARTKAEAEKVAQEGIETIEQFL